MYEVLVYHNSRTVSVVPLCLSVRGDPWEIALLAKLQVFTDMAVCIGIGQERTDAAVSQVGTCSNNKTDTKHQQSQIPVLGSPRRHPHIGCLQISWVHFLAIVESILFIYH